MKTGKEKKKGRKERDLSYVQERYLPKINNHPSYTSSMFVAIGETFSSNFFDVSIRDLLGSTFSSTNVRAISGDKISKYSESGFSIFQP